MTIAAGPPSRLVRTLERPKVNVVNFVWEFRQVSFYRDMPPAPHWSTTKFCPVASAGDAVIALVSFWAVVVITRTRAWVLKPSARHVALFAMVGIVMTVDAEWVATELLGRWTYADRMPTLPLIGTGLLPLLQWMILPPLVVWFVRRQLT